MRQGDSAAFNLTDNGAWSRPRGTGMKKLIQIIKSMWPTAIVVAVGLVALAAGLRWAGIKPAIMLALDGFYFGIISAYYWWRSGKVSYKRGPGVIVLGQMPVNLQDLQSYLKEVGSVNTSAAICSALGVLLSTLSGVLGAI
jgi:hypothetical protein